MLDYLKHGKIVGKGQIKNKSKEYDNLINSINNADIEFHEDVYVATVPHPIRIKSVFKNVKGKEIKKSIEEGLEQLLGEKANVNFSEIPFNVEHRERRGKNYLKLMANLSRNSFSSSKAHYEVEIKQRS